MKFLVTFSLVIVTILGNAIDGYNCNVLFIFGDSLSDAGNNLHLPKALAKPMFPWYGIDLGNGLPNGRFTNGRTVSDIIGDTLGLPRPPAILDPKLTGDMILEQGVNYASGGGGILNETGGYLIQRLCFNKQIELFQGTQKNITNKIGKEKSDKFFQNAYYLVSLGSNDFINNYLMPVYRDSWYYDDQTYMDYLLGTYQTQLKMLHSLGARKVMVIGLGVLGCIPLQRLTSGVCQDKTNNLTQTFNAGVKNISEHLSNTLPNATFKYGGAYDLVYDIIQFPFKYGYVNIDSPCCSFGRIRPSLTCLPTSKLCADRSKYFFWDEYHPSDSANQLIANVLLNQFQVFMVNQTTVSNP